MDFYRHYMTAYVKFDFWSEEDGYQLREDWIKCRVNVNYIDSTNIEISCNPVNYMEDIPPKIDVDLCDFHFERCADSNGEKPNVFKLFWETRIHNEFFIAIDDRKLYDDYEIYLNDLSKACRFAENERACEELRNLLVPIDDDADDIYATFFPETFAAKAKESKTNKISMSRVTDAFDALNGLLRVKTVTKRVAKKLGRMLGNAKIKFTKPIDISFMSEVTHSTDVDAFDDEECVAISEIAELPCRDIGSCGDSGCEMIEPYHSSTESLKSNPNRSYSESSLSNFQCSSQNLNECLLAKVNSNSIHQVFAETFVDLSKMCNQSVKITPKPSGEKRVYRKGTPYKIKISQRLSLYQGSDYSSMENSEEEEEEEEEIIDFESNINSTMKNVDDIPNPVKTTIIWQQSKPKSKFISKALSMLKHFTV